MNILREKKCVYRPVNDFIAVSDRMKYVETLAT